LPIPLIRELPAVLEPKGWEWRRLFSEHDDFWIGEDERGNRWLTKLRGSFYAYREIVFAKLAQSMGWSCQSSVFLKLSHDAAQALGRQPGEIHAAHWFMKEHVDAPCSESCRLRPWLDGEIQSLDDLCSLGIAHIQDLAKSDIAACLFSANERSGRFFSADDEFFIIDSEQMFSNIPSSLSGTQWEHDGERQLSAKYIDLVQEVCSDVTALPARVIAYSLAIPVGVEVSQVWPVQPLLDASVQYAREALMG